MPSPLFQKEQPFQNPVFQTCKSAKFSLVHGGTTVPSASFDGLNRAADTSPIPDRDARKRNL